LIATVWSAKTWLRLFCRLQKKAMTVTGLMRSIEMPRRSHQTASWGQITARPGDAGDKTKPDRVIVDQKDDRDRRGSRLGRHCCEGNPGCHRGAVTG
jgi:hypothetical protein